MRVLVARLTSGRTQSGPKQSSSGQNLVSSIKYAQIIRATNSDICGNRALVSSGRCIQKQRLRCPSAVHIGVIYCKVNGPFMDDTGFSKTKVTATDPSSPGHWDPDVYRRALECMEARRATLNSAEYEAAYTAMMNFQSKHGGSDSLQYADDFLSGNMTAEEYVLVDRARKYFMNFWRSTIQQYKLCKLARDGCLDFFGAKSHWLIRGNPFRVLVKPLDIANWYKAGNVETSGHYVDAILDGEVGQRPSTYDVLERLQRERLPSGAEVKDLVAKAEEYKQKFIQGHLKVQSLDDARGNPPYGFIKSDSADKTGSPKNWKYDVFISHAGEDKSFARELHADLKSIGLEPFTDQEVLLPGDHADEEMLDAADKAPVGIAIFSPQYFKKKWPMRELEILVAQNSLLPVKFLFDSHENFEEELRSSPHVFASEEHRTTFLNSVGRTTYVHRKEDYTGRLRQELCWNVVRMLAESICPNLPNTFYGADTFNRVESAAITLKYARRFPHLNAHELARVDDWIASIKELRRNMMRKG